MLAFLTLARGDPKNPNVCHANCRLVAADKRKLTIIGDATNAYMVHIEGQFINTVLKLFVLVPFQFSNQVLHQGKENKKAE
jgi:hypothetical protein